MSSIEHSDASWLWTALFWRLPSENLQCKCVCVNVCKLYHLVVLDEWWKRCKPLHSQEALIYNLNLKPVCLLLNPIFFWAVVKEVRITLISKFQLNQSTIRQNPFQKQLHSLSLALSHAPPSSLSPLFLSPITVPAGCSLTYIGPFIFSFQHFMADGRSSEMSLNILNCIVFVLECCRSDESALVSVWCLISIRGSVIWPRSAPANRQNTTPSAPLN